MRDDDANAIELLKKVFNSDEEISPEKINQAIETLENSLKSFRKTVIKEIEELYLTKRTKYVFAYDLLKEYKKKYEIG